MKINNNPAFNRYQMMNQVNDKKINNLKQQYQNYGNDDSDKELKQAVNQFTSVFLNQMFKSMRSTLPDDKLIDGGFAEDVFTEMYDREISQKGSKQGTFNSLNQILFQQLDQG